MECIRTRGCLQKPIKGGETVQERKYSGNQEAVRKDVERFFGVLQSRFEILRREMRGWDVEEVVKISQACVIMHNLIVRMQQNGDFRNEAGGQNLIREFYNTDMESTRISREEYAQNRVRNRSGTIRNWQEEVARMVLMEQLYTGRHLFFERVNTTGYILKVSIPPGKCSNSGDRQIIGHSVNITA